MKNSDTACHLHLVHNKVEITFGMAFEGHRQQHCQDEKYVNDFLK